MTDSYPTPKWLKDLFIDFYDPCPLKERPLFDGLGIEWPDRTYVNPPYSNPLPWVEKAIKEKNRGKLIVMLLKSDTSTKVFQKCLLEGEILFINRRLRFDDARDAPFASILVIFNGAHASKKPS